MVVVMTTAATPTSPAIMPLASTTLAVCHEPNRMGAIPYHHYNHKANKDKALIHPSTYIINDRAQQGANDSLPSFFLPGEMIKDRKHHHGVDPHYNLPGMIDEQSIHARSLN